MEHFSWTFSCALSLSLWVNTKNMFRQYPDFVLFAVYILFVISIFLQGCSTWLVRHSYCTIPLNCQYFPTLKKNYKKVFAFMLMFHVFALLMHFMNRFCCLLLTSRLTIIFPLMKNVIIIKKNMQKKNICKWKSNKSATFEWKRSKIATFEWKSSELYRFKSKYGKLDSFEGKWEKK